jgi:hypothetical protein
MPATALSGRLPDRGGQLNVAAWFRRRQHVMDVVALAGARAEQRPAALFDIAVIIWNS